MKRYRFGILFIILTILWMGVIFYFSSQTGTDSAQMSDPITNTTTQIIVPDYDKLPAPEKKEIYDTTSLVIRKIAHYTEYAILALLVYFSFYFFSKRKYLNYGFSLLIAVLYAVSDEFHQSFIANRTAVFNDVLIDSLGALTMILVIALIERLVYLKKSGKKND